MRARRYPRSTNRMRSTSSSSNLSMKIDDSSTTVCSRANRALVKLCLTAQRGLSARVVPCACLKCTIAGRRVRPSLGRQVHLHNCTQSAAPAHISPAGRGWCGPGAAARPFVNLQHYSMQNSRVGGTCAQDLYGPDTSRNDQGGRVGGRALEKIRGTALVAPNALQVFHNCLVVLLRVPTNVAVNVEWVRHCSPCPGTSCCLLTPLHQRAGSQRQHLAAHQSPPPPRHRHTPCDLNHSSFSGDQFTYACQQTRVAVRWLRVQRARQRPGSQRVSERRERAFLPPSFSPLNFSAESGCVQRSGSFPRSTNK